MNWEAHRQEMLTAYAQYLKDSGDDEDGQEFVFSVDAIGC